MSDEDAPYELHQPYTTDAMNEAVYAEYGLGLPPVYRLQHDHATGASVEIKYEHVQLAPPATDVDDA